MASLNIRQVSKVYPARRGQGNGVEALRDVSLTVEDGEFVCLIGPSGCGKSTLLSIVAGFIEASSGEVRLGERLVSQPGRDRGMMFQDYALFPWKSVAENVAFGPRSRRLGQDEVRRLVDSYIDLMQLRGFEDRYPHELSGGMRQRCALARVLANDPEVLLMDEPLAALDEQTRRIVQEELLRIWGEATSSGRKTVLYVTHSLDEAVLLADRIVVLGARPGRILDIIDVDLPRPRLDTLHSARFAELVEYTWSLIKDEAKNAVKERP